jgi:hypothetical protein
MANNTTFVVSILDTLDLEDHIVLVLLGNEIASGTLEL